jgi:hypothetical protein
MGVEMTKPDDVSQEAWEIAQVLWRDDEFDRGDVIIARAIDAATARERERIHQEARQQHDRYMNMAGYCRDVDGKWQPTVRQTDPHNAFVSQANALHAFAASIRTENPKEGENG